MQSNNKAAFSLLYSTTDSKTKGEASRFPSLFHTMPAFLSALHTIWFVPLHTGLRPIRKRELLAHRVSTFTQHQKITNANSALHPSLEKHPLFSIVPISFNYIYDCSREPKYFGSIRGFRNTHYIWQFHPRCRQPYQSTYSRNRARISIRLSPQTSSPMTQWIISSPLWRTLWARKSRNTACGFA